MPGRPEDRATPTGSPEAHGRGEAGAELGTHMARVRVVCLGLAGGLALVTAGGVAAVVTDFFGAPLADLPEAITWVIGLYVAASLLAARVLSRRGLAKISPSSDTEEVLEQHFRAVIVGMALREGSGVLGAVWGALAGSLPWLLVLSLPPLATMLLAWPREGELRRILGPGRRA